LTAKKKSQDAPAPVVFVSYAHESPEHKNWVKSLASSLREMGIDALLDEWKVGLGQDFTVFMDQIRTCDRVLLICTPAYCRKANEGQGGVGYERSVITAELAKTIDTSKFICLLRTGEGNESIPTFVGPRRYVDFRDDAEFDLRLDELARDIHRVPADPEPPLGENPYGVNGSSAPMHSEEVESDDMAQRAASKAEVLLSRNDMLGWKRLVRETHRRHNAELSRWRESIGNRAPSEEDWKGHLDDGLRIAEPRMALALTAVDSEIERIRTQEGLVDDFLDPPEWPHSGLECVIRMPEAIAFVYHHLLGAFLLASDSQIDAIRLLTRRVRDSRSNETSKIWANHGLIGPVVSIDRNDIRTGWSFLATLYESRHWLKTFFQSETAFQDSLRAYHFLASMLELSAYLSAGNNIEDIRGILWLDVPPMFLHPMGQAGTDFRQVAATAIPNINVLDALSSAEGCDKEKLREAFGAWVARLLGSLGALYNCFLSHRLRDLADHPPVLPS